MILQAPYGTTYVKTPRRVYSLSNGRIDVEDNSADAEFFLNNGFTPVTYIPETASTDTLQEVDNGIL